MVLTRSDSRSPPPKESIQSLTRLGEGEVPPFRPTFPFSAAQAQVEPFVLDKDARDIAVPSSINRFLKQYQRAGVSFLYDK